MPLVVVVVCMLLALSGQLSAASHGSHPSTYCTTCPRDSHGKIKRSSSARRAFLKSKGLKRTPHGCQIDHIEPLAKGGTDDPSNMRARVSVLAEKSPAG